MTVGTLLRTMSSIEIAEWIAENRIRYREEDERAQAEARAKMHPQHRRM